MVNDEYFCVVPTVIQFTLMTGVDWCVVLSTLRNWIEQDEELGKDLPEQTLRRFSKINGHLDLSREKRFTIVDCDTNPPLQLLLGGKSCFIVYQGFTFTHSCAVYH